MIKNIEFTIMMLDREIETVRIKNGRVVELALYTKSVIGHPVPDLDIGLVERYLESRAIPIGKNNLTQALDRLGLDEYNVLEILRRTHGVSKDDFYWIRFDDEKLNWDDVRIR